MKLHILSDLHTEFASFEWPGTKADVVILAGDTGVGKHGLEWVFRTVPSTPVIYVTGNHEYYGQKIPKLVNELKQLAAGSNVRVLENDAAVIGDVVFLGATLWTDFALDGNVSLATFDAVTGMSDFRRIRVLPTYRRFHPRDARRIHEATLQWLATAARSFPGKKLVVVTHHAPSRESLSPRYRADSLNPAYASNLEPLVNELGADLWIHGHIHHASDYRIGRTRVIANPRGYPGEVVPGFDPALTIEV
jgi:predicted phosphodiesterase